MLSKETLMEMVDVLDHSGSVYNAEEGVLVISDVVMYDEEEHKGLYVNAVGETMYGLMTCYVPFDKADELRKEYGSLTEYALGTIPAPGTLCGGRMGFISIDSWNDLVEACKDLLIECPHGVWEED